MPMQSSKNKRMFYPDFIRVFSMFCILLYHFQIEFVSYTRDYHGIAIFGPEFHGINTGHIGVSLFFVLSGASLTISSKPFSWKSFYKNRALTIFPTYYLVWFGAFVCTFFLMPQKLAEIAPWTIVLTFLGLDGYFYDMIPTFYMVGEWFLGCLLLIYLIYPFLRKGLERFPRGFFWLTLLFWLPGIAISSGFPLQTDHLFYLRIPEFLMGIYLMRNWKRARWYQGAVALVLLIVLLSGWIPFGVFELLRYAGIGISLYIILRVFGEWVGRQSGTWFQKSIHVWASVSFEIFLLHHLPIMWIVRIFFSGKQESILTAAIVFLVWISTVSVGAWILHRMMQNFIFRRKL